MKDGQVRYGLVCNEDGGILDDVLVYRWPYGCAMVVNACNREKIVAWLEKHKAGLDVQIQDQTFDTTMIAVQGPKAVELVAGMFADDVTKLKYYYATPTRYRGQGVRRQPHRLHRRGRLRGDGAERARRRRSGKSSSRKGAVPCGLGRATRCGSKPRCRSTATS